MIRLICFGVILSPAVQSATAEDFTNAIRAYLERIDTGIVVGLVDEHGSRIVSSGKLDRSSAREIDGDTLFEIGSVGKTFTALLLQDMVERGDMKLDDPVARYLPKAVKMPTYKRKDITLRHLATHMSGLPPMPDNLEPKRADNPYADYSLDKLYAFLSGYQLTRAPGEKSEYSNLGMGLLGHAIALKTGTSYESLVVERICRPLKMVSTRITPTPELKARFATAHNQFGEPVPSWDVPTLAGAGALRSSAHDMLKYVAANVGVTRSGPTPLMKKTHDAGLAWYATLDGQGTKLIGHSGGTGGHRSYAGFDKARGRGVVVLCNSARVVDVEELGNFLLASEWQSHRRPKATDLSNEVYDSYVGQYQRSSEPGIGIRREGDRLFAQAIGARSRPVNVLLPPIAGELLPESEVRFFERLSGMPLTFARDAQGEVTGLTAHCAGDMFRYEKISDQPPKAPVPLKPRASVRLDARLLDACIGEYEFALNARFPTGLKVTVWREGDQLLWRERGKNAIEGAIDIYPLSETNFFTKIDNAQLTFIKNETGAVTAVILRAAGLPDYQGTKVTRAAD